MTEQTRAYIYRALTVVIVALVAFGVITDEQSTAALAALAGLFGTALATRHTSTRKAPR